MFELVRRNNNHPVNTYNPFRDMEDLERSFFTRLVQLGLEVTVESNEG